MPQQYVKYIRIIFLIASSFLILTFQSHSQVQQPISERFPATCEPEPPDVIGIGRFIAEGEVIPETELTNETADFRITVPCFVSSRRQIWNVEPLSPELIALENAPVSDYSAIGGLDINTFEMQPEGVISNELITITWGITNVEELCLGFGVPYEELRQSAFTFCSTNGAHGLRVPAQGRVEIKVTNASIGQFRAQLGLTGVVGYFSEELFTSISPVCYFEHAVNPPQFYGYYNGSERSWGFICPEAPVQQAPAAYQVFQNGFMIWFEGHIFAIQKPAIAPDGSSINPYAYYYRDGWTGESIHYDGVVPEGMSLPQNGFGWVWDNNPERQVGLGFATGEEIPYNAQIQFYGTGKMVISLPDGEWLGIQPVVGGVVAPRDTYSYGLAGIETETTDLIVQTAQANVCEEQIRIVWIARHVVPYTSSVDQSYSELAYYDGTSTTIITNELASQYSMPQVSEELVVWQYADSERNYLYKWDGNDIEEIQLESVQYIDDFVLSGKRVAYLGTVNDQRQVFLWEDGITTQLSTSGDLKTNLRMDDKLIVWQQGFTGSDLYFWNGSEVIRLTNDEVEDLNPIVHDGWILWERGDGFYESEIMFWDGNTIQQLSNDYARDAHVQTDGERIVWMKSYPDRETNDVVVWDETNGTRIINTDQIAIAPQVDGSLVMWSTAQGNSIISLQEDGITTQLTPSDQSASFINYMNSHIVWSQTTGSAPYNIFYFDGETTTQLTDSDLGEEFVDLFVTDNCGDETNSSELSTPATPVPTMPATTPTPFPIICPESPPARVAVGDLAFVTISPAGEERVDLRVRNSAGGERIGALAEGTQFTVIGGPECADGLTWWQIETLDGSLTGWSAEGIAADDYYIQPER